MKKLMVALLLTSLAVLGACEDDEEEREESVKLTLVSHDYCAADHDGCGDDWGGGSDGNTGYDGEGGRSGDMEQGDGRNCRNFCDNTIIVPPGSGDEEQRPQSLVPPTPEGVKAFVVSTIQGGIGLGRLFAEGTIAFVEALMMGLA